MIVWFYWFSLVYGSDTLLETSLLKFLNTNRKVQFKSESELGVLTVFTAIIRLLINSILPCWVLSLNLLLLKSQMLSKQQTAIRRLCLWHFSGEMQGEHWTFKQWAEKDSCAEFSLLNRYEFSHYISNNFQAWKSNETLLKTDNISENVNSFSKRVSPHYDTVYVIVDEFEW